MKKKNKAAQAMAKLSWKSRKGRIKRDANGRFIKYGFKKIDAKSDRS